MGHAEGGREHVIGETARTNPTPRTDLRRRRTPEGAVVQGRPNGQDPQQAAEKDTGWRKGKRGGREERAAEAGWSDFSNPSPWEMGEEQEKSASGRRGVQQKGGNAQRSRGIVFPSTLANRIEALGRGSWPEQTSVLHGSVEDAEMVAGWLVLQAASARGKPVEPDGDRWRHSGFAHLSESARGKGFTSRLHLPLLADRVEATGAAPWPQMGVLNDCVEHAEHLVDGLGDELVCILDPPYQLHGLRRKLRTSYGWTLQLERTLALAARQADRGARVVLCEGGPLSHLLGLGWYDYKVNRFFSGKVVGEEWFCVNAQVPQLAARPEQGQFWVVA